jgi:hypothetical protein
MPDYELTIDGKSYDLHWTRPVLPTQTDVQTIVQQVRSQTRSQSTTPALTGTKDVQIDGTNTTLSFPDSMSRDQILHMLRTHPLVQQLRQQAVSPSTVTRYYRRPDGTSFGITLPNGYTPTPADLDRAYSHMRANAALSNAAQGVGLPTITNSKGQTVLPPAVVQQGIPQTPQAQQLQYNVDTSEEWRTLAIVLSLTLLCLLGYLAARKRLHRWIAQRKGTVFMLPSRRRIVAVALVLAALMTLFPPFDGGYYGCLLIAQGSSVDMGRLQMQYIILGLITGAIILLNADKAKPS